MLSESISAMSGCACLPSRICPWGLKLRLNFFPNDAPNGFEFVQLFATVLCIYTESSFRLTQINPELSSSHRLRLKRCHSRHDSDSAQPSSRRPISVAESSLNAAPRAWAILSLFDMVLHAVGPPDSRRRPP